MREDVRHLLRAGHGVRRHHHRSRPRRRHPEEEELWAITEVEIELVAVTEAAIEEEMRHTVHEGIEFAPRPPRARARGVLEDQEGALGEALRLVLEGAPQRPRAG